MPTIARPDISHTVRAVARHFDSHFERHGKAAIHISAYLHGGREVEMIFAQGSGSDLTV